MRRQESGLIIIFAALLIVTFGGIILHQVTGYHYPSSATSWYEFNVINDIYEALILVPIGLVGLWALRKGSPWGPVLIGGVASTIAYNYALVATGLQNLWIFLWILKLVLGGLSLLLVWHLLPLGGDRSPKAQATLLTYLGLMLVIFTALMGRRLLASAAGQAMEMSMQVRGPVDWAEPFVRDPIIFFSFAVPLFVAALLGLWRRADWGARATSLTATFIVNMVIMILMTGPLKELLQMGALSAGMLPISLLFIAVALPAVWALLRLTRVD